MSVYLVYFKLYLEMAENKSNSPLYEIIFTNVTSLNPKMTTATNLGTLPLYLLDHLKQF